MARDFHENLVAPSSTILDTLRIIDTHGVPVGLVHQDGRLLGTVTDGDIRRGILAGITLDAPVTRVMDPKPFVMLVGVSDQAVLAEMQKRSVLYVPLVDGTDQICDLKALKDLQPSVTTADNPVLLMAGGLGKRLSPLTEDRPKPMVEVGGRPILQGIVERFVAQGFTRIFISVNYRKEMIEDYFGDGGKWGARISYVREDSARGTAGALALLPERPARPLIVMNGDILTKVNFDHLVKFHDEQRSPATMVLQEYRFTVPYGVADTDGNRLIRVTEKPEQKFFVNAGIYVIAPEAVALVPKDRTFDMPDLFTALLDKNSSLGAPTVFPLREYWIDIGRVDDRDQAQRDFGANFSSP